MRNARSTTTSTTRDRVCPLIFTSVSPTKLSILSQLMNTRNRGSLSTVGSPRVCLYPRLAICGVQFTNHHLLGEVTHDIRSDEHREPMHKVGEHHHHARDSEHKPHPKPKNDEHPHPRSDEHHKPAHKDDEHHHHARDSEHKPHPKPKNGEHPHPRSDEHREPVHKAGEHHHHARDSESVSHPKPKHHDDHERHQNRDVDSSDKRKPSRGPAREPHAA